MDRLTLVADGLKQTTLDGLLLVLSKLEGVSYDEMVQNDMDTSHDITQALSQVERLQSKGILTATEADGVRTSLKEVSSFGTSRTAAAVDGVTLQSLVDDLEAEEDPHNAKKTVLKIKIMAGYFKGVKDTVRAKRRRLDTLIEIDKARSFLSNDEVSKETEAAKRNLGLNVSATQK